MENALGKVSSDLSDRDINRPPGNRQQRFQHVRGGGGVGVGLLGALRSQAGGRSKEHSSQEKPQRSEGGSVYRDCQEAQNCWSVRGSDGGIMS